MDRFIKSLAVIFLSSAAACAVAQPVSVIIDDPPFITNGEESALAQITISENYPDALQDGYFTLSYVDGVDNTLNFNASSGVSGSATDIQLGQGRVGPYALVYVDADDSRLDTVVVQLHATIDFFPILNRAVRVTLGEDPELIPEDGTATGLGLTQDLILARFGGFCCISIGDAPSIELEVGERVNLPLVHDHPSHADAQSFQPLIARVEAVNVDSLEILALMPGTTLIQVWNPLGQAGYLNVTVSSSSMPPLQMLSMLIEEIEALVPADLNRGQAAALTSTLRAALRSLERGNKNAACGQTAAFLNQLRAHGHLHSVVAQEFLSEGMIIRSGIGC